MPSSIGGRFVSILVFLGVLQYRFETFLEAFKALRRLCFNLKQVVLLVTGLRAIP